MFIYIKSSISVCHMEAISYSSSIGRELTSTKVFVKIFLTWTIRILVTIPSLTSCFVFLFFFFDTIQTAF